MSLLPTPVPHTIRTKAVLALALLPLALATGCMEKPQTAASSTRLYAFDFAGGAKKCSASDVEPKAGTVAPVAMTMGNDGGWCAFKVTQPGGKPFTAGLVTARAEHGKVYIHTVGDDTRIDYTPDARYAGPDAFTVQLLPGDLSVRATVTVGPA